MKVLVTGGAGAVGRAVVSRLVAQGYEVLVVGRSSDVKLCNARYEVCDVTDYGAVRAKSRGCEAIVHLAAIPSPGIVPGPELFEINVRGTFNVFHAAAEEGIRRVVQASSINALGYYYGVKDFPVRYLPVDEEHQSFTTDPYSFSKEMVENIGAYFWRREGISSVALRLPWVYNSARGREGIAENRKRMQGIVANLLSMSETDRVAWLVNARRRYNEMRAQRMYESRQLRRSSALDADISLAMTGRHNLWTIIDDRDSAQAVEKALTADYEGSHVLFVQDCYNWADVDSETLCRLFFPEVRERKKHLIGSESLISSARAKQLIGFEPQFSFVDR